MTIRKLREAVERDEWVASGDGSDTWLLIYDAGLQSYHQRIFEAWRERSLDAALALMHAVLPDVENWSVGPECAWVHMPRKVGAKSDFQGCADTPARALLLAILKALEAQNA